MNSCSRPATAPRSSPVACSRRPVPPGGVALAVARPADPEGARLRRAARGRAPLDGAGRGSGGHGCLAVCFFDGPQVVMT